MLYIRSRYLYFSAIKKISSKQFWNETRYHYQALFIIYQLLFHCYHQDYIQTSNQMLHHFDQTNFPKYNYFPIWSLYKFYNLFITWNFLDPFTTCYIHLLLCILSPKMIKTYFCNMVTLKICQSSGYRKVYLLVLLMRSLWKGNK